MQPSRFCGYSYYPPFTPECSPCPIAIRHTLAFLQGLEKLRLALEMWKSGFCKPKVAACRPEVPGALKFKLLLGPSM